MSFFKLRRGQDKSAPPASAATQTQSVEVVRKRARHRLIGASILVLAGVAGFPLLFDTQPRPVAVDLPIEIPGKNAPKPLAMPEPVVVAEAESESESAALAKPVTAPKATPSTAPERVAAAASLSPREEIYQSKPAPAPAVVAPPAIKKEVKPEPRPEPKHEPKPEPKPELKPESKPQHRPEPKATPAKPEAKPEVKASVKAEPKPEHKPPVKAEAKAEAKVEPKAAARNDDGMRAVALLNGAATPPRQAAEPKAAEAEKKGRMVIQVGAFADAGKADEIRAKLQKAGLSSYTQATDTKDGKRIRVRVGPFASKAEAERAVGKIRSLDLPVAILSF